MLGQKRGFLRGIFFMAATAKLESRGKVKGKSSGQEELITGYVSKWPKN